jgi:hypothetical protein
MLQRWFLAVFLAVLAGAPATALGQVRFEILGARALGMGGAFVAVANDPSAFHWNPAGTVSGGPFGMTVGWDDLHFGDPDLPPSPGAARGSNLLTSVAGSPLGVSYGYLKLAQVVGVLPDGTAVVHSLVVHHFGATVSQSLIKGLVVGATVKYLRGQAAAGESAASTAGAALDEALKLGGPSDNNFDIDAGLMGEIGPIRAGVTFKNLLQPTFVGDAGIAIQLKRLVRVGFAVLPTDGLTLAFDMDLDTADPLVGLRRMMALGGEILLGSRVAVRGGLRWSRDEDWRPITAAGASIRIYKRSWLDGYLTYSRSDDRGFGIALRAG